VFQRRFASTVKRFRQQFEFEKLLTYLYSFGWLLLERGLSLILGMGVAIWLARYLGPTDFGLYSYALSFVGLFAFLSYLGLDGIVTRDLVKTPGYKQTILGTVFVLRLAGGVSAAGLIVAVVFLFNDDVIGRFLVIIVAISLLFDAFNAIDFWFQSRVQNKYSALARTAAVVVGSLIYVVLILLNAPVVAFAVAFVAQQGCKAAAMLITYRVRGYTILAWQYDKQLAGRFLRQSWPLIISSAGSLIYLKVDQIMLGNMVGASEVGIYSVAAKLSEIWYVLPGLAAISIFPALVRSKALAVEQYHNRLQRAYTTLAWSGIIIASIVSLSANFLIVLLYGQAYSGAGLILAIHIWTCPIMFMGPILSKWLIVEDLLIFSLTRHGLGAVVNVLLNLLLIPIYGGVGAAIATLLSYSTAVYLACFTDSRTRIAGRMMTKALFSPAILVYHRWLAGKPA